MKERGISFQGWGVRAILEGRKTQTRRVATGKHKMINGGVRPVAGDCPYGQPGDLLWVREKWRLVELNYQLPNARFMDVQYSDFTVQGWRENWKSQFKSFDAKERWTVDSIGDRFGRWRSPIHMPRWASRLTLRLTDVRVQRVQEISEEDARAEGTTGLVGAMTGFPYAWDSINDERGYGWDANPWVWVLTFELVERAEVRR